MTEKKSKDLMHSADSHQASYKGEDNCNLGSQQVVESIAENWKQMSLKEQGHCETESKQRHDEQEPIIVPSDFTYYQGRSKRKYKSQLERELIERAKERGVDRATARQTLSDRLLWKEKGEVIKICMLRWALLVLSKDSAGVIPNEICAVVMENAKVVGELRLIRRGFQPKLTQRARTVRNTVWDPDVPSDVNMAVAQLVQLIHGTWSGLVMIPEYQMSRLGSAVQWMKQTRDAYCRRDTSTMRLDRIMCIEDVVRVFRQVVGQNAVDAYEDEPYEELRELDLDDTILLSRAVAEYFTRVMKKCTISPPSFNAAATMQHHQCVHRQVHHHHHHQQYQPHYDAPTSSSYKPINRPL